MNCPGPSAEFAAETARCATWHRCGSPPPGVPPADRRPDAGRSMTALYRYIAGLLIAALVLAGLLPASSARAQDEQNLFSPGDAVVTGFSGIQPNGALLIPGMSPLDQFFINTEGASAQILSMGALGEPRADSLSRRWCASPFRPARSDRCSPSR